MPFCNASRDKKQYKSVSPHVTMALPQRGRLSRMTERPLGRHYLKAWRKYRRLSLRALADRMEREPGVPLTSHANIGRIENFQQPYSQEIIEAAAAALNCSVTDILSVDPTKGGEVVDLMALLKGKDMDTVRAILSALPAKTKAG